jgi:hypothetical protein
MAGFDRIMRSTVQSQPMAELAVNALDVYKKVDGVYLTGWEYNRLLSADPTQARNSALPSTILWRGAHQLWMFEHVYVTKEAWDNEVYATEELGWIMGDVLAFLRDEGALTVIDWSTLTPEVKREVKACRDQLLTELHERVQKQSPSEVETVKREDLIQDAVVERLKANALDELECWKGRLLQPVTNTYDCLASGQPTDLGMWMPRATNDQFTATLEAEVLARVAQPVISGVSVCPSPATMGSAFERQQAVVDELERPRIVELIAGLGEFEDPTEGYKPYINTLKPRRGDYEDVNMEMRRAWNRNRDHLRRLRDAAHDDLWPHLHQEWLPRAKNGDEEFVGKRLPALIENAVRAKKLAAALERAAWAADPVKVAIGFAALYGVNSLAGGLGAPPPAADAVAIAGGHYLKKRYEASGAKQTWDLGIFYQRASNQR